MPSEGPTILAFDTSGPTCTVGLVRDAVTLASRCTATPAAPSEGLLPLVEACMREAGLAVGDLGGLVVGRGPGSFTGTRIAVSTAKGLALGAGLPVWGVSSLEAAALDAGWVDGPVVLVLDARRGELLVGAWRVVSGSRLAGPSRIEAPGLEVIREPSLAAPTAMPDLLDSLGPDPLLLVGDGPDAYPEGFAGHRRRDPPEALILDPRSLVLPALERIAGGRGDDPDALVPVYSRPPPVHGRC